MSPPLPLCRPFPKDVPVPPDYAEERRAAHLPRIPESKRGVFLRAWSGRSRNAAIRAKCSECVMYQSREILLCTSPTCPLWPYRPIPKKFRSGPDAAAARDGAPDDVPDDADGNAAEAAERDGVK